MYAIISKRSARWFSGINSHVGDNSSHRIQMGSIPVLFPTQDLARIELLMYHLSPSAYDIVEVELNKK